PAQQQTGAGPGVDLVHLTVGQEAHVVAVEAAAAGEDAAEPGQAVEGRGRRGKAAARRQVGRSLWTQQPGTDRAHVGTYEQEVGQPVHAGLAHRDVWVEEQDEAPVAVLEAEIVGLPVADVPGLADELDLREALGYRVGRAVAAGVVDDHGLDRDG